VHAEYDIYVRHIHVSDSAGQYKVYLVVGWLLIEAFCTKIGLDVGGYTTTQMKSMNKYERLLIELGETNYKTKTTDQNGTIVENHWPVELRLIFTSLVNVVAFIIIKMLANVLGEGVANTIVDSLGSLFSGTTPAPSQSLFGGPSQQAETQVQQPQPHHILPGGQPLPQMNNNPLAGLDLPNLIGGLLPLVMNGLGGNQAPRTPQPVQIPNSRAANHAPETPRFRPLYVE
jgi:hypothetical protein